jgi:hypothetical protein
MNLKQTTAWGSRLGRIGALFCFLLFLCLLDALVAGFRESPYHFSALPGGSLAVSGPLTEKTERLEELTFQSSSPEIKMEFTGLQSGYWLGGSMWTGRLTVSPRLGPGSYQFLVRTGKGYTGKPAPLFQVALYKDQGALQRGAKSFILRLFGLRPWKAALFLVPLLLLVFGTVFYLSRKTEDLLADQGQAEVYRIMKDETGSRIFFGLGRRNGLEPERRLILIGRQGEEIGTIKVEEVFEGHSTAKVGPDLDVRPGFMVVRS